MHQVRRHGFPLSDGTRSETVLVLLIVCLNLDVAPIMRSCGGFDVSGGVTGLLEIL